MMVESRPWSDLPMDLLQLIASRLPASAYPYFASVCKRWWLSSPLVYPLDICPLLMHYKKTEDDICHCYSPFLNQTFTVDLLYDLSDTNFHFAKDGWLMLSRGDFEIILVKPFAAAASCEIVSLDDVNNFNGFAFSCPPTSPDFMIFGIESYCDEFAELRIFRGGEWSNATMYTNNRPFQSCHSNPVFYHGLFYCLGTKGNLGVFNPNGNTWTILPKPRQLDIRNKNGFLLELGGELLSVFITDRGKPIQVLRLNQVGMAWEKVNNLRNRMLFTGWPMSLLMAASVRGMENKAYTHRFRGKTETVKAKLKHSEGRMYFVWERLSAYTPGEGNKETIEDGIYSYSLASINGLAADEDGSVYKYPNSIWFEPKFDG